MTIVDNNNHITDILGYESYSQVKRRVYKQLFEALIFEKIVLVDEREEDGNTVFSIRGLDKQGEPVTYTCRGRRRFTFGRVQLVEESLYRYTSEGHQEVESTAQCIEEIFLQRGISPSKLKAFIHELEQTILNDTMAQERRRRLGKSMRGRSYDDLEGELMDGHHYHPCYKSRIGFTPQDNLLYGPEFQNQIRLVWVAVSLEHVKFQSIQGKSYRCFLEDEISTSTLVEFDQIVRDQKRDPSQYRYIPVHPWQWVNQIKGYGEEQLRDNTIIFLGETKDLYTPQQSIRTLSNRSDSQKANMKVALHILNTSSMRLLKPHSVLSAPAISNWLSNLVEADPYLKHEAKLVVLQEYAGVTVESINKSTNQSNDESLNLEISKDPMYGAIGCIWRESIYQYLVPGEEAVPFTALYAMDTDKKPFIHPWVEEFGVEEWLTKLIHRCIVPIVHFAVRHGIVFESHAQNMILIHREGMPIRVALKDFHEGVEYTKSYMAEPEKFPDITAIHPEYALGEINQFFEMESLEQIREMMLDALFFINIGELAIFLADYYHYPEVEFWRAITRCIQEYIGDYPELRERFDKLNLFIPYCRLEKLMGRRLYRDDESYTHETLNPLHIAK